MRLDGNLLNRRSILDLKLGNIMTCESDHRNRVKYIAAAGKVLSLATAEGKLFYTSDRFRVTVSFGNIRFIKKELTAKW